MDKIISHLRKSTNRLSDDHFSQEGPVLCRTLLKNFFKSKYFTSDLIHHKGAVREKGIGKNTGYFL